MVKIVKKEVLIDPIYVRLTEKIRKRLDELSDETGVAIAEIIRQVLEDVLFKEEKRDEGEDHVS